MPLANRVLKSAPMGAPSPILADLAKQAMFNRVPLGAGCWIVRDDNHQAVTIGEVLLHLLFPHAGTKAIAASTGSQNQNLFGLWISRPSLFLPPASRGSNSKFRRVSRRTYIHCSTIVQQIIDVIENRFAKDILGEIMGIDGFWLQFLGLSSILAHCRSTPSSWYPH
jgi:hypothetical protein